MISAAGAWRWLDEPMAALQIGGSFAVLAALATIAATARVPVVAEARLSAPPE